MGPSVNPRRAIPDPPLRELAEYFTALADASRLGMLALLLRHGEMCVCDIQEVLGVTQSRASRHLRALRQAGLVQDRRVGVWVHYRIPDRPGPRERLVLRLLPRIIEAQAAAEIDGRLAAWRKAKAAAACAVPAAAARRRAPRSGRR